MITIIDYGMGNLRSVEKAFDKLGAEARVSSAPADIDQSDKVVLPGVGAFGAAMQNLTDAGLTGPILNAIESGKPFLGICLGLQLLFEESLEMGSYKGLGVLRGKVVRFEDKEDLRIPHIGWNRLEVRRQPPHLRGVDAQAMVYFVHSYYVVPEDDSIVATVTDHGVGFASAVWKDNVFATQFHPEKSSSVGLGILKNFVSL